MQLTMTGEYAIRAMIHLSTLRFGTMIQITDIAKQWDIPENFLRKITGQLISAGLVSSTRGLHGGVQLARQAESLTLLDVIEAVEGKIVLNRCLMCEQICSRDSWCEVHMIWSEAQEKMKEVLTRKTLAQLAAESHRRRTAVGEPGTLTAESC